MKRAAMTQKKREAWLDYAGLIMPEYLQFYV